MNSRRKFIVAIGASALAAPLMSFAQQPTGKIPRVGFLWHAASVEEEGPYYEAVIQGFKELGYAHGQNIVLEHRFPNEEPEKFRSMAAELVALKPDVILASGGSASVAAKNATSTIPVVFVVVPDPIGSKLVDNLARPSGNVTGLTNFGVQLAAKRLEYLHEIIPNRTRIALLVNSNVQNTRQFIEENEAAAAKLGVTVQAFDARTQTELPRAFEAMIKARMQAVAPNAGGGFFQWRFDIGKLALTHRLPVCAISREVLEAGALISYGPDQRAIFRRATVYADKILKGAKPSELPVEQPTRFEFLINGKTAKTLGIKIPNSILLRADKVVE
jgi:putative tryptophan/tyrosine transport system substrate-binding protein